MDDLRAETSPEGERALREQLTRAFEVNTDTLAQLISEFKELRHAVMTQPPAAPDPQADSDGDDDVAAEFEQQLRQSHEENSRLQAEIERLREQLGEARQQNEDLASRVASSSIQHSIGAPDSGGNDALSWEQRKEMILRQMEDDSFDASAFVSSLGDKVAPGGDDETPDPATHLEQLHEELTRREQELTRRDREIGELRNLLEQQSEACDGGVAIGAAAIAQMVDGDELVREEREKLKRLQEEWEEKFRQAEIAASLERAKLSRERQQLAQKTAELEEELAHVRRACRDLEGDGKGPSRRWLAELGIRDTEA